jgi:hypothetical protein
MTQTRVSFAADPSGLVRGEIEREAPQTFWKP